jgi:soluble lytic murein transglycosylase-like protein
MNAASAPSQSPPLRVSLGPGHRTLIFSRPFRIGRAEDCEVSIQNEYASRVHAEVFFDNGKWWVRDLNSSNGLYHDGQRVERVPITRSTVVRLGIEGPEISFEPQLAPEPYRAPTDPLRDYPSRGNPSQGAIPKTTGSGTILRQYVEHYFKSSTNAPAGEHTMYVRRAFEKIQTQQKRRYGLALGIIVLLAIGVGTYALYERHQLERQRAVAEDLFYAMKSLDLDIANLETAVAQSGNRQEAQMVRQYSSRRREMQNSYDQYLTSMHVYDRKMTEQQRIMLRVARIFGECELEMPSDFEAEVSKYIKYWRQSDRLANAIQVAQQKGYVETISQELLDQGLPPQFFYLALQESNFDPYASGPMTRAGIAKGMWQFVPQTAIKYGLRVGPLADLRRPDPGDERDQPKKATKAAARYLKDLYSTDAQASGILVMACYNWGENQVLPLVRSMPLNPRERNFWRLLSHHREQIPRETYDYVFYIVSAAVIGENPRLFGFDFDNPLAQLEAR